MDKIGDLINRIATANKNAKEICVQNSKYKREILKVLYDEGWIAGITEVKYVSSCVTKGSDVSQKHSRNNTFGFVAGIQKEVNVFHGLTSGLPKGLIVYLKRAYIDASNTSWVNINPKVLRISKPGRRMYCTARELEKLKLTITNIASTVVVSTSKGVMTINKAVELNLGGEVLFKISA